MADERSLSELERKVAALERLIGSLRQEIEFHKTHSDHPYHPHGRYHSSSDRPFLAWLPAQGKEMVDPDAPATNQGIVYLKDNGSGKTQLVVRFNTGAVQQLAIEP